MTGPIVTDGAPSPLLVLSCGKVCHQTVAWTHSHGSVENSEHFYSDRLTPLFFSFLLSWSLQFYVGHVTNPWCNVMVISSLSVAGKPLHQYPLHLPTNGWSVWISLGCWIKTKKAKNVPDHAASSHRSGLRPFLTNPALAKPLAGFPNFSTATVHMDYLQLKVMKTTPGITHLSDVITCSGLKYHNDITQL